ncbi:MAG TPA: hypothetical protein VFE98_08325 [Candidatus Bathyarchaeia archaeon]|nr:hypothetical protein [Candidatus Bathyarchaeia archaeon]
MSAQSLVIIFMGFWMYEEYLNNIYLQAYVNGYFQGSGLLLVILASIAAFAGIGVGIYAKLRGARGQIELVVSKTGTTFESDKTTGKSITILEPQVEQHLIDMIRRTTPSAGGDSSAAGLPVLKRDDSSQSSSQSQQS